MAKQSGNNDLVTRLLHAYDEEAERGLAHGADLDDIFHILGANKERILRAVAPDAEVLEKKEELPEVEKKAELPELLRKIEEAHQQWRERSTQQQKPAASKKKTMAMTSVMSDCNLFKSKPSSSPKPLPQDAAASSPAPAISLEDLLKQTKDILGNAGVAEEETVYYEWTTSYVDESRIYGWDEDANKVVNALVGTGDDDDDDEVLFRAAGIAGIHGSGKTALAQKVFVHDKIKDAFPLRLWVCVGPPDHDDRFCLLYRILDNLGLDTAKLESIVDSAAVVLNAGTDEQKTESKIGVLLFVLYTTLYKTGYLIVFDDARARGGAEGWYSNLTLNPPKDDEWYERLAYGLPKARKSAVLVTCRREEDARIMVRTGGVFRPPEMGEKEGWMLFRREYEAAKNKKKEGGSGWKEEEDKLYKELKEMKAEIVGKCLGLPVAIVEAAKGFAALEHQSGHKDDVSTPAEVKVRGVEEDEIRVAQTTTTEAAAAADQSAD